MNDSDWFQEIKDPHPYDPDTSVWTTKDGKEFLIEEMNVQHLQAVITWMVLHHIEVPEDIIRVTNEKKGKK